MTVIAPSDSRLSRQAGAQARTIGALLMREIHTRFGRENLGYLWLFLEPAILALGVAALHLFSPLHLPYGVSAITFSITGYTAFIAFRSTILRACTAIESNTSLLYHRNVTLLDIFTARALLDIASAFAVCMLLLGAVYGLGYGHLPERPLVFLSGWALMFWFSLALSFVLGAANHVWPTVERFVHPLTYLLMPLSGVFTSFVMVPPQYRDLMLWMPIAHILELVHQGEFKALDSPQVSPEYVIAWCVGLTLIGLLALRVVRTRIQIT